MTDTSVKYFNSTMANAPVLNGTAGSLINLLDACLKDGFDTKTLTSLVAASGVMTATFAGTHSSQVDTVVLLAGVTGGPAGWAAANGEQKVADRPTPVTATFATTLPDGTYTGSITMKMAPVGWAKPFTGTNKGVYRSSDPMSTGMYLRIDDAGSTFARVVGYESMADLDTGAGPFPTAAQMSGGGYWTKSVNANDAAVKWSLVADSRTLYLNILAGSSTGATFIACPTRCFGDLVPYRASGDNYACVLNYSLSASVTDQIDNGVGAAGVSCSMPREYTGLGSAVLSTMRAFVGSGLSGADSTMGAFPSIVDGGIWMSERYATVAGNVQPRGKMRGVFSIPQTSVAVTLKQENVVPGAGVYLGRNFVVSNACAHTGTSFLDTAIQGALLFDLTGPWG